MEIKDIQLTILDSCPEDKIELIKFYWKFKNGTLEFDNKPTYVKNQYRIQSLSKLNQTMGSESTLTFFIFCRKCEKYVKSQAKSQKGFYKNAKKSFKCEDCKAKEEAEKNRNKLEKEKAFYDKLNKAVETKRWEILSDFQYELLNRCLTKSFNEIKRIYWNELGQYQYKKLFIELQNLADLDLIIIQKWANNVSGFQIYARLKKAFVYEPRLTNDKKEPMMINGATDQLKFKLTINKESYHPDSPKYAGLITFKKRIVIEPNVEYSFAQWERSGNNLYLTLIPTDDLYPSADQKPLK